MSDVVSDCIFCKIANHLIETSFVAESENVVAFNDNSPAAPVHVLIVPKSHIQSAHHLGNHHTGIWQEMLELAQMVAELLGVSESGYRLVTNAGPDAGQEVSHLHLHLMGGRKLGSVG